MVSKIAMVAFSWLVAISLGVVLAVFVSPAMAVSGDFVLQNTGKRIDMSPFPSESGSHCRQATLLMDGEIDTLVYDDGEPENAYRWSPGYRMAVQMSPDTVEGECKILAVEYYHWTPGAFRPGIYLWTGSNPADTALLEWDDTSEVAGFNIFELDTADQVVVDGDFVVSHGCVDSITSLGFDPLNNGRAWDFYPEPAPGTWLLYIETYFIRAYVEYPPYGSVPRNIDVLTPCSALLDPPYPNPFNPSTTMVIHRVHPGLISLKIYDLLGREVATLVDGYHPGGSIQVSWDARSQPSGAYWAVLVDRSQRAVRKLVLLK
jgi:hypothetical protein